MKATVNVSFTLEIEGNNDETNGSVKEFRKEWKAMENEIIGDLKKGIESAMGMNGGLEINLKDHFGSYWLHNHNANLVVGTLMILAK